MRRAAFKLGAPPTDDDRTNYAGCPTFAERNHEFRAGRHDPGAPPPLRPACRATPRDEAFVGREHELGVLDTLLAQVCTDGARIALVRGAPGIGKTALVRRFLDDHPHLTAVRGSGDEGEATISYALVDQLFGAVGLGGGALLAHIERVLPVEEPIVVGRLILAALIRSSVAGPVVVVVDDAHWADVDSLRALLFAVRRLAAYPVLTILVVPPDEARLPAGLGRLAEGHTGITVEVGPLKPTDVQALAATATGSPVPGLVAHRLCAHTLGNPRHVLALLTETPADRWQGWEPVLPAPRVFSRMIGRRLAACSDRARRFVEAAAVVGDGVTLATSAALADVDGPLGEVEEACAAGLLDASACATPGSLAFADPLVRAAVYGQLTPVRRLRLHREAALLVDDERAALHHRAAAAQPPDDTLADELQRFSDRSRTCGQWREAAWALLESGRLSAHRGQREQRLLRAVGLLGDAGAATGTATRDLGPPAAHGPMRDVTNGYVALVQGRAAEAHGSLHAAWTGRDQAGPEVAALIAQRLALHGAGRLQGVEVVEWARRALELAAPEDPVRVESLALLGLGLGWVGWPPAPHRAPTVGRRARRPGRSDARARCRRGRCARGRRRCRTRADAGGLGVVRGVVLRVVGARGCRGRGVGRRGGGRRAGGVAGDGVGARLAAAVGAVCGGSGSRGARGVGGSGGACRGGGRRSGRLRADGGVGRDGAGVGPGGSR